MKVILIKDILGKGKAGEVKDFADGYAENFVIAKGYGIAATPDALKRFENEKRQQEAKQAKELAQLKTLKNKLEKGEFEIPMKAGADGKIFGSPTEKEIVAVIKKEIGVELERNQIDVPHGIRRVGDYKVEVDLGNGVIAEITITIVPLEK